MNIEKIIPVSWTGWDIIDTNWIALYNAEFIEDFGIFKKGDKIEYGLSINYGEGLIQCADEFGDNVKEQCFKAIAI